MLFAYRAVDAQGQLINGKIRASDGEKVLQVLRNQGYIAVYLDSARDYRAWLTKERTWHLVSSAELVHMTRQWAVLLGAGLPLLQALTLLRQQTGSGYLQHILEQISMDVGQGQSLGNSLARHKRVFPLLYINVIKMGELTGRLEPALNYLAAYLSGEQKIRARIRMAMIYPAILAVMAALVLVFMVNVVLPEFSGILTQEKPELPWLTSFLISLAGSGSVFLFLLLLAVAGYGWYRFYLPHYPNWQIRIQRFWFSLPVLGKTFNAVVSARMSKILGLLLRSGADLPASLHHTAEVIGNAAFAALLLRAEQQVKNGESLSVALADELLLAPFITQLVATGEESGRLESMLLYLADYYEETGLLQIDMFLALLEPLLIIGAALAVGSLVLGLLLPLIGSMEYMLY